MSDKHVKELLGVEDLWHESVRAKLSGYLDSTQFQNFSKCGKDTIYRTCAGCRDCKRLTYRCSIKWCPRCNWMISRSRSALVREWARRVTQPKHLVLTQRNFPVLTRSKIREHQKNLARLRKQKVFRDVKGGCVSVEITNEGNGWHLHSHWLIDARWIDAAEVAVAWGKLCGQSFGIVKVKDARNCDYAAEVAKYVVKGNQLAKWESNEILQFVTAVKGIRFFFTFGNLSKLRPEIEQWLAAVKPDTAPCDCGCSKFCFEDERRAVLSELKHQKKRR